GPLESEIREQAAQGKLRHHVTVYGFAEAEDVVAFCKACDALLIPSRQESMPIIYSDSVQCGCPIVATDVGDLGRFVREQKTGIVCPPEDPDALAEAIYAMVTSKSGPRKAYAHALSEAAAIFDPAHNAARFVEVASTLGGNTPVQSNQ
ncbi:MAG: glycosyltransferase family 4 protein, partial [Candidatus Latescibacteria bacterium]|nr:glycosyltransferase family 4 protein [Candidatus Latescibacterota bacterium]